MGASSIDQTCVFQGVQDPPKMTAIGTRHEFAMLKVVTSNLASIMKYVNVQGRMICFI